MNCQEFEANVMDIARGGVMDAVIRTEGLAHARSCVQCQSLLADHQDLTSSLRALALKDQSIEPPSSIEQSLLEALREATAEPVAHSRTRSTGFPSSWKAGLLAAAMLIISIGVAFSLFRSPVEKPGTVNLPSNLAVTDTPTSTNESPAATNVIDDSSESMATFDSNESTGNREIASASRRTLRKAVTSTEAPAELPEVLTGREITTDFIPIPYGSEFIPIESGRLIRVRMPRSTLLSFGLPMSQERADEQVTADIVVSNEGMAHAIRFVQ